MLDFKIIIAIIVFSNFLFSNASAQQNSNVSSILDSLMEGYDKRVRPNYGKNAVNVGVSMHILSIHSFSESDMEFTMDFYFRQYWNDPRLAFRKSIVSITPGYEYGRGLWFPDTFFVNEKESFLHTITTKNEFVRIDYNGNVVKSLRLSVTFSCSMNFIKYPMDKQTCTIPMESYGHNANDVSFYWRDGSSSVSVNSDITLPLFSVSNVDTSNELISLSNGNYSRISLAMEFQRGIEYYLVQIYIPCNMIVIMAYISFFLNKNASNIRLVMCIVGLLSLIVELQCLNTYVPKTSYAKALDIYTGICMTLVFLALIEFAFVANTENYKNATKTPCADKIFRILYPIFFIVFNIIYWMFYCSGSKIV
ncbi:gamma-aminobutyric acid receptor subunit beta-like [Chironomus tepperi]|uniref:gamma-aminobutyric acid receptor subunit beta-like n=1 Tax=Chironomus tepperi TaxID=113505 RepID=UPI00391FA14B